MEEMNIKQRKIRKEDNIADTSKDKIKMDEGKQNIDLGWKRKKLKFNFFVLSEHIKLNLLI